MAADVPADEAELGLLHAGGAERAGDVLDAAERRGDVDGRFILGLLVGQGTRDGLPGLADADFRRGGGVGELGAFRRALAERAHRAARELPLAVAAREGRVSGAGGERVVLDLEVLVGGVAQLLVEFAGDGVAPLADLDDLARVEAQRGDDGEPGAARGGPAEHRHVHALLARAEEAVASVPFAVVAVGREPIARLALFGVAEHGRDAQRRRAPGT